MNLIKSVTLTYLVLFTALFIWAGITDPRLSGFFIAIDEAWGAVVFMDFVFGCLLMSWMIYFIEGSAKAALPWVIALFIVGNIIGALYLLLNFDNIKSRLSPTKSPTKSPS